VIKLKARNITILTDDEVSLVAGGSNTPRTGTDTCEFSSLCGGYTVDWCEEPTQDGYCLTVNGCDETKDCP